MNVLLIGSGGREHALAWRLAQSAQLGRLICVPGNPGTAQYGQNVPVSPGDHAALVGLAQREAIGLVVIGPEDPLAAGLADAFRAAGVAVFGPSAAAARIESSKTFAKQVMHAAGVPTAAAYSFDNAAAAAEFVHTSGQPWVVKADGLAAGKGVVVATTIEETLTAITQLAAAPAGTRLLLEERLVGRELSVLALCDGQRLLALPPARDHKRLADGDAGPNTGGMGAVAPVDAIDPPTLTTIVNSCMQPVVDWLAANAMPFRGALYAGLMLTAQGLRVLEFNARFGDPEAQVVLPLIGGDLLAALAAAAAGELQPDMLQPQAGYAACVVLAAHGYPGEPRRGDLISGIDRLSATDLVVFHAGTALAPDGLVTAGGRVLGVTGMGPTLPAALERAYAGVAQINFAGMQYRRDIGRSGIDE